jgi:hypothetical protein
MTVFAGVLTIWSTTVTLFCALANCGLPTDEEVEHKDEIVQLTDELNYEVGAADAEVALPDDICPLTSPGGF